MDDNKAALKTDFFTQKGKSTFFDIHTTFKLRREAIYARSNWQSNIFEARLKVKATGGANVKMVFDAYPFDHLTSTACDCCEINTLMHSVSSLCDCRICRVYGMLT